MVLFSGEDLRERVRADRDASLHALARMARAGNVGREPAEALARRLSIRPATLFVGSETVDVTCPPRGRDVRVTFSIPFGGDVEYLHASQQDPFDDDDVEVDGCMVRISFAVPLSSAGRDLLAAARGLLSRHDAVVDQLVARLEAQSAMVAKANGEIAGAVEDLTLRNERAASLRSGLVRAMSVRPVDAPRAPATGRDVEEFPEAAFGDDEVEDGPRLLAVAAAR